MNNRYRTIVTTDGEIDDMNSFLRLLLYSNEFDIEGIVLTSSIYHYAGNGKDIAPYRWTGESWINEYIDAYEKVYPNLIKHSNNYPRPDYLRSIYYIGNISDVGEMREETEGSKFLEQEFLNSHKDTRKLYIQTWGGTNTTARALKSIEEKYKNTPDWQLIKKRIEDTLVIYIILDQDVTYNDYIVENWDIPVINDSFNFWYFAYMWKQVSPELTKKLTADWHLENLPLKNNILLEKYALYGDGKYYEGEVNHEQRGLEKNLKNFTEYEQYDFISEGDSPSFFYLINNGLQNADNPEYGGWGGRFKKLKNSFYRNDAVDYNPYSQRFEAEYSLTRWFDDIQTDFASRINWTMTNKFEDSAHYPVIEETSLNISVKPNDKISLSVNAKDLNNLELKYNSWCYYEASTYWNLDNIKLNKEDIKLTKENEDKLYVSLHSDTMDIDFNLDLKDADTNDARVVIPGDAKKGDNFHIITEVQNISEKPFKTYIRRILTVE